ncbi:type III pantothenate kinase [Acetobacteraceae bacterium KSS8]|uniref:Type III pantothenate kinase n=1 Tax=Endosaccharibacter trunci TaxID=2812733 RepID=A0ABT1W628_9PROT|nr:type III pantothenate kinase [Acetobacteraceae bacterium KSS8]
MLLVIDAGNTNIVFAVHDGVRWRGNWRIATDIQRTSDEYAVWLLALLERSGLSPHAIRRAVIGTVVPAALYHLRRFCRDWLKREPLIANLELDWGFEVRMDQPTEVGVDRLLDGLAAHTLYGGPALIVDFGTATTFNVVGGDGSYNGGAIAPGINLSIEALHLAAARLPRIAIGRPQSVIGKGTIAAMRSGIFWGYIGLVEGIVARVKTEFGAPMKVIGTGGLAPLLAEGTDIFERIDPDLTIEGLRILAGRNPARSGTERPLEND